MMQPATAECDLTSVSPLKLRLQLVCSALSITEPPVSSVIFRTNTQTHHGASSHCCSPPRPLVARVIAHSRRLLTKAVWLSVNPFVLSKKVKLIGFNHWLTRVFFPLGFNYVLVCDFKRSRSSSDSSDSSSLWSNKITESSSTLTHLQQDADEFK